MARENISTQRKIVPVPLCSPQIPHGQAWDYIWASTATGLRLTSSVMARSISSNLQASSM